MDKPPENASTRPLRSPERPLRSKVEPARSHHILVLFSLRPMELHVEIDALVSRIADGLRKHEERLLSELMARISRELGRPSDSTAVNGQSDDVVVKGIQLYALYSTSFLAGRWNVSADNVRKKSQSELPRSDWKGGEIRYRGVDILRYEGVEIEDHLDRSSSQLGDQRGSRSPESSESNGRSPRPDEGSGDERPYNGDLPSLSDKDSPPD